MRSVQSWAAWLVSIEIWPVALILATSIAFPAFQPFALIIALLFWPLRWLARGHLSVRTPLDWSVAGLVIMIPVTLWASVLPQITLPQVLRLILGIVFFYAVVNWSGNTRKIRVIVLGMIISGLMLSLLGLVSVKWTLGKIPFIPNSIYERLPALISDTIHRNVMAGYLVLLLPIGGGLLFFAFGEFRSWEKIAIGTSLICMVAVLFLTQARGAWGAFVFVLILLLVLRWRMRWVVLPLATLAAVLVLSLLGNNWVISFLFSDANLMDLEGRIEIWSRALYMIHDFPITGIGMGLFGTFADKIYPFFMFPPGEIPHAHNLYLQIAVDLGIPGLIAWLATLIGVIAAAWQVYCFGRRQNDVWVAGLGAGLLGSQVALMIQGLIDAVIWGMVRPAPIVWGVWGLTIASWYVYIRPSFHPEKHSEMEMDVGPLG